jgi:hypothetical protein
VADSEVADVGGNGQHRWHHDVWGLACVVIVGVAVMTPALIHGSALGPYDMLGKFGLGKRPGTVIHNKLADQILLFIPWTIFDWTQIHHAQLPLWNPYSVLGMPQMFNWESAPFGLPALVGYLFPLRFAYTVAFLTSMVVAGTGVYVLGRVVRLGVIASVMAAIVFELSGQFIANLGWPLASVMSWAGWLFAFAILIVRGRHPSRDITLFAVVLAMAVYAGYPEAVVMLVLALTAFLIVLLASRTSWFGGAGPVLAPLARLVGATVAGAALAAPLALPGLQLSSGSARNMPLGVNEQSLGPLNLVNVIDQSYYGLPWHGSRSFGIAYDGTFGPTHSTYTRGAAYVGVIALVLVVLALTRGWRRPVVMAFGAVFVVTGLLVFAPPAASAMNLLPGANSVRWYESLGPLALATAVLAGVGTDLIIRSWETRAVRRWTGGGFAVAGLLLLALWTLGRGHLPSKEATIRSSSFLWPAIETVCGLAVVAALVVVHRRKRRAGLRGSRSGLGAGSWAALSLLACETAFLVTAGAPVFSSSPVVPTPTTGEVSLQRATGTSVVGFGVNPCNRSLGSPFNFNIAYSIREFAVYDPITPRSYFASWSAATGHSARARSSYSNFCPAVTSSVVAREFGIPYVLEPPGSHGPRGSVFDRQINGERLYRIPGAAAATLTGLEPSGQLPAAWVRGTPVSVEHPDATSWKLVVHAQEPQVLRLRLTNVPGWHATLDGRPLALTAFSGVMLQARVPAGNYTIDLTYWPDTFTDGIVLATVGVVGLLVVMFVERMRQRGPRTRARTAPLQGDG